MLKQPEFWQSEAKIPLMVMNKGYLDENNLEHAFERAKLWLTKFKEPLEIKPIEWPVPELEPTRIITKDVERTFTGEQFRHRFSRLLTLIDHQFGDYHQGLGFLTSFLILFLDDDSIVAIARRLNESYIPGYWKHEAVDFVTDAYVLDHLLKLFHPQVHAHLAKSYIMPGTYPQKWFVALCVHLLPFDILFEFFNKFFERGVRFLFQFALGFFKVLGPEILKSDNPVTIFAYLRLDYNIVELDDSVYSAIVAAADEYNLDEIASDEALTALRKKMYDQHLGAKYEAVSAKNKAEVEDEDDDFDFDEEFEAEPGSECQICENMVPDYWCNGCSKFICGMCHERSKAPHLKDEHKKVSASSAPPEAYEKPEPSEDSEDVKELEESLAKTSV